MLDWGNWIVFLFYLMALYPLQFLVSHFLFKSQSGVKKIFLVSLAGIPLTLILYFVIVTHVF
jgi:hypothetical protein